MPQALAPILPTAPEVSLVTSAHQFPEADMADAFAGGLQFRDDFCLPVDGWPRCPTEDDYNTGKVDPDEPEFPDFVAWTVYVPVVCSGKVNVAELKKSAQKGLEAKRAWAIGRELWTGAISGSESLQSTAVDVSATSPMSASEALATLVGNLQDASGGSQAFVHCPAILIDQLASDGLVERRGDRLVTPTGDIVVPGPGYPNSAGDWGPADSDGYMAATADEAWMFVTGPVELAYGPVTELGSGDMPSSTFARLNKYTLYVEQDWIFRFPPCAVFGALVSKAA